MVALEELELLLVVGVLVVVEEDVVVVGVLVLVVVLVDVEVLGELVVELGVELQSWAASSLTVPAP